MLRAELTNIRSLLSGHYFKPAEVQRQYIWDVSQCEAFHNDLVDAFEDDSESQYYLGPIILTEEQGNRPSVKVYDGQQRLTTLTIYMAVFSRLPCGESEAEACPLSEAGKLSKATVNKEIRPRIDIRSRGGALKRVVNNTPRHLSSNRNMPVDWRIYNIEKKFRSLLGDYSERKAFAKWVMQKVVLNVLWAEDEKGLILFDRANNRGVKLEWYELVKSVLSEALGENFRALQKPLGEFWYETERATGVEFSDLLLITSFILYQRGTSSQKTSPLLMNSASALVSFEDRFDTDKYDASALKEKGKLLFTSLASYRKVSERLSNFCKWDPDHKVKIKSEYQLIEFQLYALEYPHWKSLLMFAEGKISKPEKKLKFLKRVRYIAYTAHLLRWSNNTNKLEYLFKKALNELEECYEGNGEEDWFKLPFFDERQLNRAIKELSIGMSEASAYRPLVKLWESQQAFNNKCLIGGAHFLAHVEHIFPRAPHKDWDKIFPNKDTAADLKDKLGNLCLLSKAHNYEASNLAWPEKSKIYSKTPKCFVGAHATSKNSVWSEDTIETRTKEVADGIAKILGY